MKNSFFNLAIMISSVAIFVSCDYEEQILPANDALPIAAEFQGDNSLIAVREKTNPDAFFVEASGTIDGRDFSGDLTITRFVEDGENVFAVAHLTEVQIKGKDHKYLEHLLESETYTIPLIISGDVQASTEDELSIAQTCTILNLNLTGVTADVLGLSVQLDPITATIDATDDQVLGNLICTVLDTLNNVVALVDLLNQILGLLSL